MIAREDVTKLLRKIRAGNEDAKNALFSMSYPYFIRIAWRYAKNKDDAEDILVEAFSRAFVYIDTYDPKKDGFTWMCSIIQHCAYDFNKQYEDFLYLEDVRNLSSADSLKFADEFANKDFVHRGLQRYGDFDRELVYKHFWDGKSFAEISDDVDLGKSGIHKRVDKILKNFLKNFQKEVDDQDKK